MIPMELEQQQRPPTPSSSSQFRTVSSSSTLSRCHLRRMLHVLAMYPILLLLVVVCLFVSADDATEHDEAGYSLSATPISAATSTSTSSSTTSSSTGTTSTSTTPTTTTTTATTLTPYLINIPSLGKIQGSRYSGIDFFGGIPYASPPVGNLRFAPPEEPTSWKPHVLDATHFGPDCWQIVDPIVNPLANMEQMSEDCLYLNIFSPAGAAAIANSGGGSTSLGLTPATSTTTTVTMTSAPITATSTSDSSTSDDSSTGTMNDNNDLLPVMLWFHGGAFQQGGSRRPEYDGRRIAEHGNVIVVTVNYRLGSLGFLVSSQDELYGNYGLMDQRAAIVFVQSNIQYFGGDPNSITLFGESAGAVMIGLHLLMDNTVYPTTPSNTGDQDRRSRQKPKRQLLFHRAIMQSNPLGYQFRSVVVADFLGDAYKRALDCNDITCLRSEPVEELMRAQSSLMGIPRSVGDFFTWGPTLTQELQLNFIGGTISGGPGGSRSSSSSSSTSGWNRFSNNKNNHGEWMLPTKELEQRFMYRAETYHHHRRRSPTSTSSKSKLSSANHRRYYYSFDVNVTQPLMNLDKVLDEIPVIIGTNAHEGEMFVHGAFPIPMSKAVYWMFVGALFKDSATKVLKHYRPYVAQVESDAQILAEKQIQEEENKQFYMEHQHQLEEEYRRLLALNNTDGTATSRYIQDIIDRSDDDDDSNNDPQLVPPEVVEQLIQTFSAGGGGGDSDGEVGNNESIVNGTLSQTATQGGGWKIPRLPWPLSNDGQDDGDAIREREEREREKQERVDAQRKLREERRKERQRAKALKEAAKVVVDYRPVMSRIITDYLFRCPSWHYAHMLSENRVKKGKQNNVYVYRFSQPTHVPGFKECWGKSCHTAELPYVFESMEIIRSNYSTLSEYAQKEAPAAPEYPYTDILAAFRGVLEEQSDEFEDSNQRREDTANTNNQAHMKNNTRAFQRILTHFFGDYFREDADEEIASDMAERWVAFARSGDPNYVDSKVKWIPWRYIPSEDLARNDMDFEDYLPWESDEQLPEFWTDDDDDEEEEASYYMSGQTKSPEGFLWADDRGGRAYRKRALRAMNMAVAEEDILRTELSRTIREPDLSFALKFLSNFGITTHKGEERMPLRTIRQVQRIAQEMGVLGTGLRSDDHGRRSGSSGLNNWNENFFPQLLELKWPPEERLVERDCTCDFWEKIRYRY